MVRFTGWGGSTRAIAGLAAMLLVAGMGSAATAITLDSTEELTTQSVEPEPVETPSDAPSVDPAPEPAPSPEPAPAPAPAEDTPAPSEEPTTPVDERTSEPTKPSSTTDSKAPATTQDATVGSLDATLDDELGDRSIMPLMAGAETDISTPYIYWEARSTAPGNALIGGASFRVAGPRSTYWFGTVSWGSDIVVEDNVGQTGYSGADLDPDPGEFLVKQIGSHDVLASNRYRVQRVSAPGGYSLGSTSWVEQAGSGNSGTWNNGVWDAGDFAFALTPTRNVTITMQKGVYRTGTGNTDMNGSDTAGVRFGVFLTANASDADAVATCTIQASDLGNCVFPATALPRGATVYVRELEPVAGSVAAAKLGSPLSTMTTGTTTGGFTNRPYQIAYEVPDSSGNLSVTLPNSKTSNTWDSQSGRVADRVINPTLPMSCTAGVDVAVVLDTSGSVGGYQNILARATTALVDGLTGTPSSVALFSFDEGSPGRVTNRATPQSVLTEEGRDIVRGWYSTNNGQTANFTPANGTNWDMGLWQAAQGSNAYGYDIVFVLTDGNPTYSASRQGSGSLTTFREIERAVFSSNAIKDTGARVITVGIGDNLSGHNLAAISGPNAYSLNAGINDFDYLTANWSQLESVMRQFAQGLSCEATVTVEKQAKPYGETLAPAQGWQFGIDQDGASTQTPSADNQWTANDGTATWSLKFTEPNGSTDVTLTELEERPGWSLKGVACTVDGASISLDDKTASLTGVGVGDNVKCTFTNEEYLSGTLAIEKEYDLAAPLPPGLQAMEFDGDYACTLGGETVAAGTWASTGTGAATLTPTSPSGSAAETQTVAAGASCVVTENTRDGGLPNASWKWGTETIGDAVTISNGQTSTVKVTNRAERVYGNFSITKVVPEDSVVTDDMMFGGDWSCTLDGETVTGTWGPIAAGATWNSTNANEIPLGASCVVTEARDEYPVTDGSYIWDGDPVISGSVNAASVAADARITVTNTTRQVPGSVTWTKVDGDDNLLAGAVWTLTGPGINDGVEVADCVSDPCRTGAFDDQDPVAGQFELVGLSWGDYTLVEKTAPAGYFLDTTPHEFTIGEGELTIVLDPIENVEIVPPTIPLTGGIGRDFFFIAGGGVLLLGFGAVVVAQIRNRRREVA